MSEAKAPPTPLFTGMTQVAFASENPAKLAGFYRDVLGLEYLFETAGMVFLRAGGVRLMIGPKQPNQDVGSGDVMFYFEPTVWSATEKALTDAGVTFLHDAATLMRAEGREMMLRAFKDPEGHTLAMFGWRAA